MLPPTSNCLGYIDFIPLSETIKCYIISNIQRYLDIFIVKSNDCWFLSTIHIFDSLIQFVYISWLSLNMTYLLNLFFFSLFLLYMELHLIALELYLSYFFSSNPTHLSLCYLIIVRLV